MYSLGSFFSNGASDVLIMYSASSRCIRNGRNVTPLSIQTALRPGKRSGMPLMVQLVRWTMLYSVRPMPWAERNLLNCSVSRSCQLYAEWKAIGLPNASISASIGRNRLLCTGWWNVLPTTKPRTPGRSPKVLTIRRLASGSLNGRQIMVLMDGSAGMICLPFNDPDASLRMVKTFGDRPGVLGFVVGSTFHHPVHSKRFLPIYAEIEALGKPMAFHSAYNWHDRLTEQFNKFLSAHGIGRTLYNIVHLTNWTINGIPERFPGLKAVWIESGVTFLPFLMQRLDAEYMMRTSEAPLLKKLPSEYMQEYFYTAQPLENTVHQDALAMTFDMIHAETQLMYASDYPHWDFDVPSVIYDLPF